MKYRRGINLFWGWCKAQDDDEEEEEEKEEEKREAGRRTLKHGSPSTHYIICLVNSCTAYVFVSNFTVNLFSSRNN
jgi:hypothetical protein